MQFDVFFLQLNTIAVTTECNVFPLTNSWISWDPNEPVKSGNIDFNAAAKYPYKVYNENSRVTGASSDVAQLKILNKRGRSDASGNFSDNCTSALHVAFSTFTMIFRVTPAFEILSVRNSNALRNRFCKTACCFTATPRSSLSMWCSVIRSNVIILDSSRSE